MARTPTIIGNWKMNVLPSEVESFVTELKSKTSAEALKKCALGIAPQHPLLPILGSAFASSGFALCSQDIHWEESGAHTGEVSPAVLKELGVRFAIIGHSERRQFYGETDANVAKRCASAIAHDITAVVCVGESEEQYKAGKGQEVTIGQLRAALAELPAKATENLVIAYEPVWAIGTGLAATPDYAEDMHTKIRETLCELFPESGESVAILYGGSTKPGNIAELMARKNVDGALVGGSSLNADTFAELINNGSEAY